MSSEVQDAGLLTLTVKQLSKATGIQVWRVHQLVAEGKAPRHFRVGRVIRFRAKDVDAWLDEQSSQPEGGV